VSILITPLFFAPDAISVDANSINDAFEVKGRFGRVKSSQLEVYNRWGEVVFSGPGKEWNPDGNMPSGTYFYKILITLNDNSIQTKAGKIELIR
jgi:gliding motility-associated-like protein